MFVLFRTIIINALNSEADVFLYDILTPLFYISNIGIDMIEIINSGGVTSAQGFSAGGTYAGLKTQSDTLDLGVILSEKMANVAATFTTNSIESPSVSVSRKRLVSGTALGVIANSGCANCSVGEQGFTDAEEMTELAASFLGGTSNEYFVASTGMIHAKKLCGIS